MASLGSYIRSAARATFSAYKSLPIRWRLAGGSAALTFVILASFAVDRRRAHDPAGPGPVQRRGALGGRSAPAGARRQAALHRAEPQLQEHEGSPQRLRDRRARPDPDLRPRPAAVHAGPGAPEGRQGAVRHQAVRQPARCQRRELHGRRLPGRGAQPGDPADRQRRRAALRPPAVRRRPHARPGAVLPDARRARRHDPGPARGAGHRPARHAPDRRADARRAGDRAHARSQPATSPIPRPATRSRSSRARSRGCSERSTRRAARPRRCSTASASSSPTRRTSCERR